LGAGNEIRHGGGRLRPPRLGELVALAGAICVIISLLLPWYEGASGSLSVWETFGPAAAVLIAAAVAALALVAATVTERSTALPVAAAVWSTVFAIAALIAAAVRLLERPDHASSLCAGAWLALAGALAMLAGSWQSMRDERAGSYPRAEPPKRQPPPP
jgi:H+/Cl- antiporter ClcA